MLPIWQAVRGDGEFIRLHHSAMTTITTSLPLLSLLLQRVVSVSVDTYDYYNNLRPDSM